MTETTSTPPWGAHPLATSSQAAAAGEVSPEVSAAIEQMQRAVAGNDPQARAAARARLEDIERRGMLGSNQPTPQDWYMDDEQRQTMADHHSRAATQDALMGFGLRADSFELPRSAVSLVAADDPVLAATRGAAVHAKITPQQWNGLVAAFFGHAMNALPGGAARAPAPAAPAVEAHPTAEWHETERRRLGPDGDAIRADLRGELTSLKAAGVIRSDDDETGFFAMCRSAESIRLLHRIVTHYRGRKE